MDDRDVLTFLSIRDTIGFIDQKVNLIGIIIEFSCPKRSKGTDYCCTLKIIDESCQTNGISVNVFAENVETLPHVASCGDIIQLHHIMLKRHAGEVNAVFNKKFSSFALYKGEDGQEFVPYQVSAKFRPNDLEQNFIVNLRGKLDDIQLEEDPSNFPLLRYIKEGERVDLICKVLYIFEVSKDELMVFVWDGTDTPPVGLSRTSDNDEKCNSLPLHLERVPLPFETLCTFPTVGTILRLTYDQGIEKNYLQIPEVGKWAKFLNVLYEMRAGLWCGVLTPFTRLRYTTDRDFLVLERERLYNERLALKYGRMPLWTISMSSWITDVSNVSARFLTLMDVLTHSEVTAKFKCVARAVAALPEKAYDIRSPCGLYRFRLTLEDPTARIHAYVCAEDGETLFGGYPSVAIVTRKLNKLLGVIVSEDGVMVGNPPRNPPWLKLCIKSYYKDKSNKRGSRHYRIFGTRIVDDP